MKRLLCLLALLLLPFAPVAQTTTTAPAPASCWVVSGAVGYTVGSTVDGRFAGWWCPKPDGTYSRVVLVTKNNYILVHPSGLPATATPAETAAAYWRANVSRDCGQFDTGDAQINSLCDAAYAATDATKPNPLPPPSTTIQYIVSVTQAFPLKADGTRSIVLWPQPAIVGEPADGSVKVLQFGATFCKVPRLSTAQTTVVAGCRVKP